MGTQIKRSAIDTENRRGAQLQGLSDSGANIHTTLDVHLQWYVEEELAAIGRRSEPEWTTAVLVDVKTGDILAMANTPTYDPNVSKDNPAAMRNHALRDFPEPGSVIKPMGMALALRAGVVSAGDRIDCEGGKYWIGRTPIRDDHAHDVITISEVIKYSSNICSAKMAAAVGAEYFIEGLKEFGFAGQSAYPAHWVNQGVIRNPLKVKPIELATTAFGQGMTASPLQVVMAVSALANGGVLMKPRLVTRIENTNGDIISSIEPAPVRRVVSSEIARTVTDMMVTVMEPGGTGAQYAVDDLLIAGKTGTAQIVDPETRSYGRDRTASFVGFAPAEDPAVALIVVAYRPQKGVRYGGTVTGEAFSNILDEAVRYLGVVKPAPIAIPGPAESSASVSGKVMPSVGESGDGLVIPDFWGLSVRDAFAIVGNAGLKIDSSGSGFVRHQSPAPGIIVPRGSTISFEFH